MKKSKDRSEICGYSGIPEWIRNKEIEGSMFDFLTVYKNFEAAVGVLFKMNKDSENVFAHCPKIVKYLFSD